MGQATMAALFFRSIGYQMFRDVQLPDPSYGEFHQPFHDWPKPRAGLCKFAAPPAHQHGQHAKSLNVAGDVVGLVMS